MGNEELPKSAPGRFAPGSMDHVLSGIESPEEREKIFRIAHESGIRKEDPVWSLILLVLDAQDAKSWAGQAAKAAGESADRIRGEIRGLPEGIKTAVSKGLDDAATNFAKVSNAVVAEAAGEIEKTSIKEKAAMAEALGGKMDDAVKKAIDKIVDSTYNQAMEIQRRKWGTIGLVAAAVILAGAMGTTGWFAWHDGKAAQAAIDGEIRSDIDHVAKCDEPGWKIEEKNGKRVCFPYASTDGFAYGWRLK